MNNDDRYLAKRPTKLQRKARLDEDQAESKLLLSLGLFILGALTFVLQVVTWIYENPPMEIWVLGGVFTVSSLLPLCAAFADVSFVREVPEKEFGHDAQARGLYDRIRAVTKHSTAGWDDDLWQAFFTVGKLLDEKRSLTSARLAQELHDEIDVLVGELDDMITAREALVDQRRRLGLELTVPGTEAQRIASGVAAEMEELAMRPLLRQRLAEVKPADRRELE